MPKPAHTRITWSGVFGEAAAPIEEWQFSLNMGEGVFANLAQRQSVASAMRTAWSQECAGASLPLAKLTRVRVAQVDAVGLVDRAGDGSYNQGDVNGTWSGTGVGTPLPLQIALCVSLTTARPGATGKGRFYLPAPAVTLDDDTRIATARAQSIATSMAAFITVVDNAWTASSEGASPGGNVVVASSAGYASIVTGIRVGRVLDTQRRRRGDLPEQYEVRAVAQ